MNRYLENTSQLASWNRTLRRFLEKPAVEPVEVCELCSASLPPEHEHLIESETRRLFCSCLGCAILFGYQSESKYQRIPKTIRNLKNVQISDVVWQGLGIPIGLAYFTRRTPEKVLAQYPSAGGAIESWLELECWEELSAENPVLNTLKPEVESLLVNRIGSSRSYYLVPIDECFKLVGLIRKHWQGFSGGNELWWEVEKFFNSLDARSMIERDVERQTSP